MSAPIGTNPRSWAGDPVGTPDARGKIDSTESDPTIRKLYGPKGEVLLTISDRPPVGFHQGERQR